MCSSSRGDNLIYSTRWSDRVNVDDSLAHAIHYKYTPCRVPVARHHRHQQHPTLLAGARKCAKTTHIFPCIYLLPDYKPMGALLLVWKLVRTLHAYSLLSNGGCIAHTTITATLNANAYYVLSCALTMLGDNGGVHVRVY